MAFDGPGPTTVIVALLKQVLGSDAVQLGAPLDFNPRVGAYVTAGHQPSGVKAQGTIWRDAHYFIDLAYRISENVAQVATAETAIFATLDVLQKAIYADKTLGGTCQEATIDTGLADQPEYRTRSGPEWREYPVIIVCRQYDTYQVNP